MHYITRQTHTPDFRDVNRAEEIGEAGDTAIVFSHGSTGVNPVEAAFIVGNHCFHPPPRHGIAPLRRDDGRDEPGGDLLFFGWLNGYLYLMPARLPEPMARVGQG